jgi:hypothetical protein
MLFQDPGAVHGVDPAELLVPDGDVEEVVWVLSLHERHGLLELSQVPLEDLGVVETVDELGEVVDVLCQGGDAVRVDLLDVGREREGLLRVSLLPGDCVELVRTRIISAAWARASK